MMTTSLCLVVLSLMTQGALPAPAAGSPDIRIEPPRMAVRVTGLEPAAALAVARLEPDDKGWSTALRVIAVDPESRAQRDSLPSLLGRYRVSGEGEILFEPRFPPAPGLVIAVSFNGPAWDRLTGRTGASQTPSSRAEKTVPKPEGLSRTRVLGVYPQGEVPANLLRFYVHFSAPMSARHVLPHVRLLDREGNAVSEAFVEVPHGLWDPDRTRLTLFVHPGRLKRGVGPGQVLGPVLEEGRRYRLQVASTALDDAGSRLAEAFEAEIRVGPRDSVSPDPSRWRLEPPTADGEGSLRIALDQPADHALLSRLPAVFAEGGSELEGTLEADPEGRHLAFTPQAAWKAGRYRLEIPAALEDPAGNRLDRLFEEKPSDADVEALPFVLFFEIPEVGSQR